MGGVNNFRKKLLLGSENFHFGEGGCVVGGAIFLGGVKTFWGTMKNCIITV